MGFDFTTQSFEIINKHYIREIYHKVCSDFVNTKRGNEFKLAYLLNEDVDCH